jgi:IS6 family transposase
VQQGAKLRQVKFLNNIVEQDHRRIKRLVRPRLGFKSFATASRTVAGHEVMAMVRKGQVVIAPANDMRAQREFIAALFGAAA